MYIVVLHIYEIPKEQLGDKYGRAGRLALVEDASGGEAYYYGRQGEVTKTVRTVMASVADIRTYVYGATYDSWNRVRTMTYPDGEVVTYHYNAAGQVESLTSSKTNKKSVIVAQIGYDKDGYTVYQKLGNGTETTYTYDKQRERLQDMTLTGSSSMLMQNKYRYDAVDNILKAMWQSALTGAVSGAISGGIESYENCKDNGVNPFTGNHEGSRRTHYPLRNNVNYNLQPDKTKDCYSYALEYTSKQLGHPETADSFINAANGADGADVSKVLNSPRYKGALKNYRLIRLPRDTELEQITKSFELGRYSSVISLTEHHAVALSQYDTVIRNCWFGGSVHIVMDNIQIFDPLIGIRPFYGNVGAFDIIRVKF